jgi:hypothetical protein
MAWKANLGRAYITAILAVTLTMIWGSILALFLMLLVGQ